MQFDETSLVLVKRSSITLALIFTLVAIYSRSFQILAFGLLTIVFVPLSVWALDSFPPYIWFGLLAWLQQQQPKAPLDPRHALIAPAGQ